MSLKEGLTAEDEATVVAASQTINGCEHAELTGSTGVKMRLHACLDCIVAALRRERTAEFERLYGKLVQAISADIAGDFDAALDQLVYNAGQDAREKAIREAVQIAGRPRIHDAMRGIVAVPDFGREIADEILALLARPSEKESA